MKRHENRPQNQVPVPRRSRPLTSLQFSAQIVGLITLLICVGCAPTNENIEAQKILNTYCWALSLKPGLLMPPLHDSSEFTKELTLGPLQLRIPEGADVGSVSALAEGWWQCAVTFPLDDVRQEITIMYDATELLPESGPGSLPIWKYVDLEQASFFLKRPERLFKPYDRDIDLFVAIFDTVPEDLKFRFGNAARRTYALLSIKHLQMSMWRSLLWTGTCEISALVGSGPVHNWLTAILFDRRGSLRGYLYCRYEVPMYKAPTEDFLALLVRHARFAENAEQP